MAETDVSAIIAVYNGQRYIAEAIESILAQTCPPAEVIVVDDGSTDNTAQVAARYPQVQYQRQENVGQPAALNRGVTLASSNLLAFLDADDVWLDDKTEAQLEVLTQNARLDMVFGLAEQFAEDCAPAQAVAAIAGPRRILPAQLPSAMLIRRTAFERTGGFRGDFAIGNVVDWYARAMEMGLQAQTLDRVVYRRRIHDANSGLTAKESRADYMAVVKAALERRRAASKPEPPDDA